VSAVRTVRGGLLAAALGALVVPLLPMAAASADQTYYVPLNRTWEVNGRGYGHGIGMSQYGAQGAALEGLDYRQIVRFYYPGTDWGAAKGKVRVLISADTTPDLIVKPDPGLTLRDLGDGATWRLPRGAGIDRWRLTPAKTGTIVQYRKGDDWVRWETPDGRRVLRGDGELFTRGPVTLYVPGGSDVVPKRYRGVMRLASPYAGSTTRDTVNVLTMDQYVLGVVPYEMPTSWHQQALRAQAVAARTYAAYLRAQNPKRYYQVCDTTSCQVYGGVAAEVESSNKAVLATKREILTYRKRPALTQFSASSGGWTAAGSAPYLAAKRDRYDGFEGNGVHRWSTKVDVAALEAAHPEIGTLERMRVTKRDGNGAWNGRVLQIRLEGTKDKAFLTGDAFRWQYGLRSSWFSIAPTPIMERWRALGGKKSPLGAPRSGEFRLKNGAAQDFQRGRIFWSRKTGAREVRGKLLTSYMEFGGPGSRVGWPVTGMEDPVTVGKKVRFEHGRMYFRPRTGAWIIFGPILKYWTQRGATASDLGFPVRHTRLVAGGMRTRFEGGVVDWDRATDTFTTRMR
jgi:SpoIID/LytB domain protein